MIVRPPGAKPGELAFGIALFVTAFAIRMRVALSLAAEPVWDGHYYDFGAKRIAEGQGYSDEIAGHWHAWCHYPVGYSAYLGAFYKLFGTAPWVAHFADALAGGLLALVTFGLLAAVTDGLGALGAIPGAGVFEVALNMKVDPISDDIDVIVYAEFKDEEALFAFKRHPTYDATTQLVRPMRELRFSADVVTDKG